MGANLVLCTATQPTFDNKNIEYKIDYGGLKGEEPKLYEMTKNDYKVFERNKVNLLKEILQQFTILQKNCKEIKINPDL